MEVRFLRLYCPSRSPSQVKPIDSEDAFADHLKSLPATSVLVVYFHAPWAAPCKQMAGVVKALASTYSAAASPPRVSFVSIDAEALPALAEAHGVVSVPLTVLMRGGVMLRTVTGCDAAGLRDGVEGFAGGPDAADEGAPGGFALPPAQRVERPPEGREPTPLAPRAAAAADAGRPAAAGPADEGAKGADREGLFKRLETLVKAAPVMLFMKGTPSVPQCGFSRQLVALLRERGVRYGFFNILADDDVRQGLKEFSDWPTFPQLYVDGELIGGLDIVGCLTWDGRMANGSRSRRSLRTTPSSCSNIRSRRRTAQTRHEE
jgi:Grx4 family monothiol glutaredoxin